MARRNQNLTPEEATRKRLVAESLGYKATSGPYAGQGSAFALDLGILAGDVALIRISNPDLARRMANIFQRIANWNDIPAQFTDDEKGFLDTLRYKIWDALARQTAEADRQRAPRPPTPIQAEVERLNNRVVAIMRDRSCTAADAIDATIAEEGLEFVAETNPDDTDGGHLQACRLPNGEIVTVWMVSTFADAREVEDPDDFESAAVGFDDHADRWWEE